MATQLIVTVDTEEEGLWSGEFKPHGNTVENLHGLPAFHEFCRQSGVAPTYLVDTPVAEDRTWMDWLTERQTRGECEIGAHLHPWCAPPFTDHTERQHSYMCNLPTDTQRAKLTLLTRLITARTGQAPTSFRAGRYGLAADGARCLVELGYRTDSSVLPFHDYTSEGGPNFRGAPLMPYYPMARDLLAPRRSGGLVEIPISAGFSWRAFSTAERLRGWATTGWRQRIPLQGALSRLGLTRRIKLCPEQQTAAELKSLVAALLSQQVPCLVLMLHSTSLLPGFSPYVRDAHDLLQLYERLAAVFEYCLSRHACVARTLSTAGEEFRDGDDRRLVSGVRRGLAPVLRRGPTAAHRDAA